MSDDEGPEEYNDYEDIGGEDPPEENEQGLEPEEVEPEEADEEIIELEDAAGTDDDEDEDEDDGATAAADDEEPSEHTGASAKAQPQRSPIDPILRMSNKHRIVSVVPADERMTDNRLHKSEAAYIIAMRAEQIAKFATSFTTTSSLHDPVAIAFKELFDRRCPYVLRRSVGTGPAGEILVEDWKVREMTLPPLTPPVPLGGTATTGGAHSK